MPTKLTPVNKMLVVEKESNSNKQEDLGFVLPERVVITRHSNVVLKSASEGSLFERFVGQKLVVVTSMMEDIEVKGTKHTIIPENGVVAVIAESDLF